MTAPIPTIQVLLDDGSGTYPTDVTGRVSLAAGVSVSGHGRTDEFSTAGAAQFSCTLRNDDGGLSNALGFGLGPFGVTPFGGLGVPVYPGQGIRYKETKGATTSTVFTGQISSLDLGWTGGTGKAANVTLTAVDPLAALGRRAALRSMLEQEILRASPAAYYTLGEPEGSTSAGDTSGHSEAPLVPIMYGGTTYAFGTDLGIPDGSTGLSINNNSSPTGAIFAKTGYDPTTLKSPVTWTSPSIFVSAVFKQNGFASPLTSPAAQGGAVIAIDSTGHATFLGCTSPQPVTDGLPHVITGQAGNGLSTDLWVDGVKVASTAPFAFTWTNAIVALFGAGITNAVTTWSHFAYGARVSDAQVTSIHQAAAGTLTETTSARMTRLAAYVGAPATTTATSNQLMAIQATSGLAPLDALQAVADAEGGVLFCRGDGTLVLQGRGYRSSKLTPTITVPMKDISPSTSLTTDTQQIVNSVTATRTGGATQLVTNAPSIASYGLYGESLDLAVADDASALAAAQWLVASHAAPVTRMGSVTVNLLTSSQAEQIMAAEVGDRWALSGLPAQTWTGFGDLIVEGWSRTLSVSDSGAEWSMSLNLLPWSLFTSLVLDNATYGALDAYPLGY